MEIQGKKVLLVEETYNDREFWYPYYRLKEAGAQMIVVGPEGYAPDRMRRHQGAGRLSRCCFLV